MSIEFISLLNDLSEIVGPEERALGRTLFDSNDIGELVCQLEHSGDTTDGGRRHDDPADGSQ